MTTHIQPMPGVYLLPLAKDVEPSLENQRNDLISGLQAHSAQTVVVHYAGEEGSGNAHQIDTIPAEAIAWLNDSSLLDALRCFTLRWLDQQHSNWKNHHGSYGEMVLDVPTGCFTLRHSEYLLDVAYHQHTL